MNKEKSVIEVYKEKSFTDRKEKVRWLEKTIYKIEDSLIELSYKSPEYKEALQQHSYLQDELSKYDENYQRLSASYDNGK